MNHAQGKLEIENDMGDSWLLVDENGYVVARDNIVNTDNNPELSKANARHLKRGWNNHDELLEACEGLMNIWEQVCGEFNDIELQDSGFDGSTDYVGRARQAIARAKEVI